MKYYLILIFCFSNILLFGQKKVSLKFYNLKFNLDSLNINVKVQRIKRANISESKHDSIISFLVSASKKMLKKDDLIIINYYPGSDKKHISNRAKFELKTSYKRYLKKMKKFSNVKQFFIYKSLKGTAVYGKQLHWIKDKFGIIENTFFPIHYGDGSYVLINKFGSVYVRKGEYNINKIIDLVKNKETTFTEEVID